MHTSSASGAERNRNRESTLNRIVWCLKTKETFRNLRDDRNEVDKLDYNPRERQGVIRLNNSVLESLSLPRVIGVFNTPPPWFVLRFSFSKRLFEWGLPLPSPVEG